VQTKDLTYKDKNIQLNFNKKNELFFDDTNVKLAYNLTEPEFKKILEINERKLVNFKDYFIDDDDTRYWSKLGMMKLSFFTQEESNLNFIDFIDNIQLQEQKQDVTEPLSNDNLINIYKTLENKFVDFSKDIEKKGEENVDPDELKKLIETFNLFVQTRANIFPKDKAPVPTELIEQYAPQKNGFKNNTKSNGMLGKLFNLPSQVEKSAFQFAQGTRENAFDFAQDTRGDAYNFANNTQNSAYNFAKGTSGLAFDFAMKTEDDAYKFASQLASDAYHFASDGMNYGYMFASQGEELGPMANRVLWMASQIGLMSDRIGEMSDRIVHTEHLIINMSVMILNFGLLIDGTIKTITEAGLQALGIIYDKEKVPELQSSKEHINLIGRNVELILTQQHEYDLKVLENQKALREITNQALDKIKLDY